MNLFITNRNKQSSFYPLIAVKLLVVLFSIMQTASSQTPQTFESAEKIQQTAKNFLEKMTNAADNLSIEVKINNIDSRLKLRHCESELSTDFSTSSKKEGRVTLVVKCLGPVAWKVFVSATVYEYSNVVIATQTLSRKTLISARDTAIKRVNVTLLRKKPITELSHAVGSTPKRFIRSGSIIYEDSICMVCRGDNVQVLAKSQFFNINMKGIALADASKGEITLIRNVQSKRSFNARVIGKNQLEVSL